MIDCSCDEYPIVREFLIRCKSLVKRWFWNLATFFQSFHPINASNDAPLKIVLTGPPRSGKTSLLRRWAFGENGFWNTPGTTLTTVMDGPFTVNPDQYNEELSSRSRDIVCIDVGWQDDPTTPLRYPEARKAIYLVIIDGTSHKALLDFRTPLAEIVSACEAMKASIIFVLSKRDLKGNPSKESFQEILHDLGYFPGAIPWIEISSRTGMGITELIRMCHASGKASIVRQPSQSKETMMVSPNLTSPDPMTNTPIRHREWV